MEQCAQAINFPAVVIVLPIEVATRNDAIGFGPIATLWRVASFSLLGIYAWFLAGRAVDSVLAMICGGEAILPKAHDWVFSVCAALPGVLGLGLGLSAGADLSESVWYGVFGLWWLLTGVGALSFYIYQWPMIRKAIREACD